MSSNLLKLIFSLSSLTWSTSLSSISISQWKLAKVIPLHKKEEVLLAKNYRPVALLAITSKILERAVFGQVIEYFETNNLLHPSHHGFRSMHNTSTAMLQMFDTWLDAMENDDISAVIMLDLSAAYSHPEA